MRSCREDRVRGHRRGPLRGLGGGRSGAGSGVLNPLIRNLRERTMKSTIALLAFATSLAVVAPPVARAQAPIGVSYQPSLYWALPFHYATVKGWWKDVGLSPNFSTFPAGAPQIAASAAKSWDVGGTGSVPAVLGAVRFNILTIGITNDESKANAMMVRGDRFDAVKANPASLKGQRLLLTTNSTVDYASRKCLV